MKKTVVPLGRSAKDEQMLAPMSQEPAFAEVVGLIREARQRAGQVVNTVIIDLYWHIGQYLHHKIEADGWAKGTVVGLHRHA